MSTSRTISAKKGDVLTIKFLAGKCKNCGNPVGEWKFDGPTAIDGNMLVNLHLCQKCFEKSTQNS